MKYIKLFESYYEDLTPYTYGRRDGDKCLNIGWIGKEGNFETGEVPGEFTEKLEQIELSNKYKIEQYKGFHRCELCGVILGSQVKKIEYDGKCYKFPNTVSHYVREHQYKPPQEFIDAIMGIEVEEKKSQRPVNSFRRSSFKHEFRK